MWRLLATTLLLCVFPVKAEWPQEPHASGYQYITGRGLLEDCEKGHQEGAQWLCQGYIYGATEHLFHVAGGFDVVRWRRLVCLPEGKLAQDEIHLGFLVFITRWMKEHRDQVLKMPAFAVIQAAWRAQYPCDVDQDSRTSVSQVVEQGPGDFLLGTWTIEKWLTQAGVEHSGSLLVHTRFATNRFGGTLVVIAGDDGRRIDERVALWVSGKRVSISGTVIHGTRWKNDLFILEQKEDRLVGTSLDDDGEVSMIKVAGYQ